MNLRLQRNGMPQIQPEMLSVGDIVKVNCYRARIVRVIHALDSTDRFRGHERYVRLLNPVYEVKINFEKKYNWNAKRVYIPPETSRLKLFKDEFEVVKQQMTEKERVAA